MFVQDVAWYKKQQYRKVCLKRVSFGGICLVTLFFVCFAVLKVMAMEDGGEERQVFFEEQSVETEMVQEPVLESLESVNFQNQTNGEENEPDIPVKDSEEMENQQEKMEEVIDIAPDSRYLIAIDAGHGGVDEGCSFEGIHEKDVNFKLAYILRDKLEELGFSTVLIRKEDEELSLQERTESVKEAGAHMLISIHQNSCEEPSVQGVETWYFGEKEENKRLARLVQQYTVFYGKAKDRGIMESENLYLLRECTIPACLVETGFLSNEEEREKLQEDAYAEKLAQGIADGVELYFYPKTMYLTFDDGPNTENTNAVLDILKEKKIKATFFLVGKNVERNPETARRIVEEGHSIGVHCYNHDYNQIYKDVESYVTDFERAKQVIYEVTGVETKMFRFPGGSINSYNKTVYRDIVAAMTEAGYVYFDWNASLEDAVKKPVPEKLLQNAKESTLGRKQVVMLAHDTVDATVECLEELLELFPEYEMKVLEEEVEGVRF